MTEIFPSSTEWKHVYFRTQLITADPSIEIVRVIKYPSQFQQKYINHMKIDCAISTTSLSEQDCQQLKYGNPSRFIFEAGHIKNSQTQAASKSQSNSSSRSLAKTNKLLFFKIAVDQCLPIHKSGIHSLASITEFPLGIDTIYVSDAKDQLNIYPHKYRVRDKSQCLLQYEVDYVVKGYDSLQKWSPANIMCEYCQVNKAIYYCVQDKQVYCGKCFEELHRTTRKKTHEAKSLSPFNSTNYCSFHHQQKFTYYCFDCMELRCDVCIKNQVHKNDKKHSEVMLLSDLQQTLIQKEMTFMKQAKNRTKQLILKAEKAIDSLSKSYENLKKELQQKFAAKLTKIKEDSNKKLMRAIALHSEYKRKYDELLWVQNFVHYCEQFMLVEDNVQMKDSFFHYLENITPKEYYIQGHKCIQQLG